MSWFGSLFGSKPVLPTTAPPPKNAPKNKNTGVLGENHVAVPVAPVDPTATQIKATPHPTATQGGQQGGRRSVKSRKAQAKGKGKSKSKSKSRSTSRK